LKNLTWPGLGAQDKMGMTQKTRFQNQPSLLVSSFTNLPDKIELSTDLSC